MARTHLSIAILLAACAPALAATPGVSTIANPGGGMIAYAQLPQQHTAQGAMGKVLQYVESNFGARPAVGKYMKSPDGNSLAATFTVTKGGTKMAGLALVAVSENGPGAGAVLSDTEDHFRTSLKPMLARLQQEAAAKGSTATAQAAIANAGGANAGGSPATSAAKSSAAPDASSSEKGAPIKPSAPPEKLTQAQFPDGSGSLGLPAGWSITGAREGDVTAQGPHGEKLRFGAVQPVIDPSNPQSRALGRGPRGAAPGNFVAIPAGTPGDTAFKMAVTQLAQKQHRPAPVINFAIVKPMPAQGAGTNYFMQGTTSTPDGTAATWIEVMESPVLAAGSWQMNIYQITVPEAYANQEANTVASMFQTYKTNDAVIMGQIGADNRQVQQITSNFMRSSQQMMDASDRSTQATSNYLRGNTVISDSDLNAHGTVSDDVANALIAADPNRFQAVSSSSYVQGIDY